jgi:hypothetical protein
MTDMLDCPYCGNQPTVRKFMDEDIWSHNIVEYLEVSCGECCTNFSLPVHAIEEDDIDYNPILRWNTRN